MKVNDYFSSAVSIGILQLVFIVLKYCRVIRWSWLWVLSPLWITYDCALLALVIGILVAIIKERKGVVHHDIHNR